MKTMFVIMCGVFLIACTEKVPKVDPLFKKGDEVTLISGINSGTSYVQDVVFCPKVCTDSAHNHRHYCTYTVNGGVLTLPLEISGKFLKKVND